MIELFCLYLLGTMHSGFAGFREATGRNQRIRKRAYFVRAVLRGLLVGQVAAAIIFATLVLLGALPGTPRHDAVMEVLRPGCRAALWIYGVYAAVVLGTFAPYLYPSLELRALTIVAAFSLLTLSLPAVILAGAVAAVAASPAREVIVLFAISIAAIALVEPALAAGGWSAREAARANGEAT